MGSSGAISSAAPYAVAAAEGCVGAVIGSAGNIIGEKIKGKNENNNSKKKDDFNDHNSEGVYYNHGIKVDTRPFIPNDYYLEDEYETIPILIVNNNSKKKDDFNDQNYEGVYYNNEIKVATSLRPFIPNNYYNLGDKYIPRPIINNYYINLNFGNHHK